MESLRLGFDSHVTINVALSTKTLRAAQGFERRHPPSVAALVIASNQLIEKPRQGRHQASGETIEVAQL